MTENKIQKQSTGREIQIGGGTYTIERIFSGKKTVNELIIEQILSENERRSKEQCE